MPRIKVSRNKKSIFFQLLVVLLICLPAVYKLVRPGFFSMYDDMQVIRLEQMDKCIADAQIPCRWVPDLGYGYGYPLFEYYAPLPYYMMEAFHLFGFSLIASVKTGFILSVLFSAIFFFLFVSFFLSFYPALISTLFYIYSPIRAGDLYVRGAMGELWGLAVLPLVFYAIERLFNNKNLRSVGFLGFSIGLFSITHNLTVLMSASLIVVWILIRLFNTPKNNRSDIIKKLLFSAFLGFCLSAFFLIPLLFERNLIHLETLTQGYFNYLAHFVSLKQLFLSYKWGYGASILGPNDDTSFGIGIPQVIFLILSLVFVWKMKPKQKSLFLTLFILVFVYAFLTHQRSTFVWQAFSFLSYLQFPWRFLAIMSFCLATIAGLLFSLVPNKLSVVCTILICILTIGFYNNYFSPKNWFLISDEEKLSGKNWENQVTASIYDYLPKSAEEAPNSPAPDNLIIENGSVDILESTRGTDWFYYDVQVTSRQAGVVIPTFDFPYWKIKVDGVEALYERKGKLGSPGIKINEGNHKISVKLGKSPPRTIGDSITLLTVVIFGFICIKQLYVKKI